MLETKPEWKKTYSKLAKGMLHTFEWSGFWIVFDGMFNLTKCPYTLFFCILTSLSFRIRGDWRMEFSESFMDGEQGYDDALSIAVSLHKQFPLKREHYKSVDFYKSALSEIE